jgi:hypothetical protein
MTKSTPWPVAGQNLGEQWEVGMIIRALAIAAAAAATMTSASAEQATDDHLGTIHFPISCSAVQGKFDRAVAVLHNFFYPETVKAFQAVIQEDPSCAIAYWGVAMSELPNLLGPPFLPANLKDGWKAIQQGKSCENADAARGRIPHCDRGLLQGLRQGRPEDPGRAL